MKYTKLILLTLALILSFGLTVSGFRSWNGTETEYAGGGGSGGSSGGGSGGSSGGATSTGDFCWNSQTGRYDLPGYTAIPLSEAEDRLAPEVVSNDLTVEVYTEDDSIALFRDSRYSAEYYLNGDLYGWDLRDVSGVGVSFVLDVSDSANLYAAADLEGGYSTTYLVSFPLFAVTDGEIRLPEQYTRYDCAASELDYDGVFSETSFGSGEHRFLILVTADCLQFAIDDSLIVTYYPAETRLPFRFYEVDAILALIFPANAPLRLVDSGTEIDNITFYVQSTNQLKGSFKK